MVLFVDLEDENAEPPDISRMGIAPTPQWSGVGHADWRDFHDSGNSQNHGDWRDSHNQVEEVRVEERLNPNKNAMTEALGCYPIITSLASHLDLNTLDSLSQSCRQIRANLLQYRSHLLTVTLHCENEDVDPDPEHTFRYRARAADWYFVEQGRDVRDVGKVGSCARDMVGECRRCARVVCRNCTIKPPAPVLQKHRHRRICGACTRSPLSALTCTTSLPLLKQALCNCPSAGVYLCQPCGRSLRSSDSEYEGIWKWRTRYLPSLGGLGVGIGEGNRGVPCGRGAECVAAREVESEIDCDAEDARDAYSPSPSNSNGSTPVSSPPRGGFGGVGMGPGYSRHEIEGIGGVVKRKLVVMVKVGACVPEWEDEKAQGRFMVQEQDGKARSWCGWCCRVIPGEKDVIQA
ncbi:hypothetical protein PVAG01_03694 [Phlyctema vagabunda]|uniref:Uncharacterized protein n=1 Tax=Phlyctema vagabunda TaxID=108571 RepID=A0ABR4PM44_9HELO